MEDGVVMNELLVPGLARDSLPPSPRPDTNHLSNRAAGVSVGVDMFLAELKK